MGAVGTQSRNVGGPDVLLGRVSSNRRQAAGLKPQLYISAVVTKVEAGIETLAAEYPAIYVTAQDASGNNHTPAWDFFEVQQIPPK